MKNVGLSRVAVLAWFAALVSVAISGCSNSGSSSSSGGGGGRGGTTSNTLAINVNTGPAVSAGTLATNSAFTSITVCVPGSTSQCQTISGILVDTGSSGVRILSSALTLTLPQQKDSGGNAIAECTQFVSDETWGPVQTADLTIGSETAGSQAIQVIGGSGSGVSATAPTSCSSQGPVDDTLASFGANGILGVGNFIQDCGPACAPGSTSNPGFYYTCPSSGCVVTTEALTSQVSNPVVSFAKDNNGVIVELPSATSPQTSLAGSLIFGIGTQSNNGLGGATVYTLDATGEFTTLFQKNNQSYSAFLDTGSNAIYFLDTTTTGMPICAAPLTFWYCPTGTQNFTAVNQGTNSANTTINFSVGNAQTLTSNQSDGVAPGIAGPSPNTFDWGLPFFYGRNVFVAIEGQSTPGGTGPYVAY
jgi:Protein of unknown function (DUF3443)